VSYGDTERENWTRRPPMTKQDKLEQIRKMKAELAGEPKESNTRD
jgi:hypothetical protein